MTKLSYRFFFIFTILNTYVSLIFHAKFQPKISRSSGEEVYFVIFAIFSNRGHLGYLTWPNFTILRPWSQVMLHVKFDNNWCNGFRETVVWSCLNMLFLDMNWSKITLVNRKQVTVRKLRYRFFYNFIILNTYVLLIFHAKIRLKFIQWFWRSLFFLFFAIFSNSGHLGKLTCPIVQFWNPGVRSCEIWQ